MTVRASRLSVDFECVELGQVSGAEAVALFRQRPWAQELAVADERETAGRDCVTPDLTLTAPPEHMTVEAMTDSTFNVEVCLRHQKRLFGLIPRAKFYILVGVDSASVEQMISLFCSDSSAMKHPFFANLERESQQRPPRR